MRTCVHILYTVLIRYENIVIWITCPMFTKVRKNCSFYVELVKNSAVYFQDTCLCSLDCVDVQMCINVLTLSLAC